MSKERDLLKRWVLAFGDIHPDIKVLKETQELLAQPEQEPVAWMQDSIELYVLEEKSAIRGYVIPLYLAPPKREPLSDEKIMILGVQNLCNEANSFKPFGFARAIEKAHGIGGGE